MTTRLFFTTGALIATIGCHAQAVLTQQVEAGRLVSELQAQFSKTADASNRAVMSEADEESAAAVAEAGRTTAQVQRTIDQLQSVLTSMGYSEELTLLAGFTERFDLYRRLDGEILSLALENTNVKAQRLAFGAAAGAIRAFRSALAAVVKASPASVAPRVELLAARATTAVLDIAVLQPPHIAEADDAVMTQIEQRMAASDVEARKNLAGIGELVSSDSRGPVQAATAALDRFAQVNREIVALSRRNSDVRSLALSLGQTRTLAAQCDEQLTALQAALAAHTVGGSR